MSFASVCFCFGDTLQPRVPQQPILKRAITVNANPAIASKKSFDTTACTIIAIPISNLKTLIIFQLSKKVLFMCLFFFIIAKLCCLSAIPCNKGYTVDQCLSLLYCRFNTFFTGATLLLLQTFIVKPCIHCCVICCVFFVISQAAMISQLASRHHFFNVQHMRK